ncbi:hypothetical protein VUR80DRAFT_9256 [Thermomyces stellatus]
MRRTRSFHSRFVRSYCPKRKGDGWWESLSRCAQTRLATGTSPFLDPDVAPKRMTGGGGELLARKDQPRPEQFRAPRQVADPHSRLCDQRQMRFRIMRLKCEHHPGRGGIAATTPRIIRVLVVTRWEKFHIPLVLRETRLGFLFPHKCKGHNDMLSWHNLLEARCGVPPPPHGRRAGDRV